MNSQGFGLRVASAFFALFAVAHMVRLVKQAQVTVGTHQIPMSLSVVALIIAAILSIWLWRLSSCAPAQHDGIGIGLFKDGP
jgi:ABC-type lipoprotein release transport system permease subunit